MSTGDRVRKLLFVTAAAVALAYALPKLLARSNTQVIRINQHADGSNP